MRRCPCSATGQVRCVSGHRQLLLRVPSGHRHRETPGITEIDVLVAPTQVAGGFKLI